MILKQKKNGKNVKLFPAAVLLMAGLAFGGCGKPAQGKLYDAIAVGDQQEVEKLLDKGADPNELRSSLKVPVALDYENIYPLEKACKENTEIAYYLIEAGADVNAIDPYLASSPLIYALSNNRSDRFELAKRLVEEGADINHVNIQGATALNLATHTLSIDSAETKQQSMELFLYLLENCDVEKVVENAGTNPLFEAAVFNNCEVAEYLLEKGLYEVDGECGGSTPLIRAVNAGNTEMCELLLRWGADPDHAGAGGITPREFAVEKGKQEVLELFD